MSFNLREYQKEAIQAGLAFFNNQNNTKDGLIIVPTGGGKSLIIAEIVRKLRTHHKVLIITPRKMLIIQNSHYLDQEHYGIMSGNLGNEDFSSKNIVLATYQTLLKRKVLQPDLVIVDEAHLIPEENQSAFRALLHSYNVPILGLTATPFRDNNSICDDFSRFRKLYEIGIDELISQGYIVPPKTIKVTSEYTLGDENQVRLTSLIGETLTSLADNNRKRCLVFCSTIDDAENVARILRDHGERAHCYHSYSDSQQDQKALKAFKTNDGSRMFITSVNQLTTGTNLPITDSLIVLRKVSSLSLWIQIIGRGLRLSLETDKTDCLIYDFCKNTDRYGPLDDIFYTVKTKSGNTTMTTKCPCCGYEQPIAKQICDNCGEEMAFNLTSKLENESTDSDILKKKLNFLQVKQVDYDPSQNSVIFTVGPNIKVTASDRANCLEFYNQVKNAKIISVERVANDCLKYISKVA